MFVSRSETEVFFRFHVQLAHVVLLMKFLGLANLFELVLFGFLGELFQVTSINGGLVSEFGVFGIGQQAMALVMGLEAFFVLFNLGLENRLALAFILEKGLVGFLL